jgi:hypothetical protein
LRAEDAVGAHAGQDDGERVRPECRGYGTEEYVHGGTTGTLWRTLIHSKLGRAAMALDGHVEVAGGDPCVAGLQFFSGFAFVYSDQGLLGQAFGEQPGE